MFVKIGGQLNSIEPIELTSILTTILIHTETETGTGEVYKCLSSTPNHYHLLNLLSSDVYNMSEIDCGYKDFVI